MEKKSNNLADRKDSYTAVFLKAAGGTPTDSDLADFRKIFWHSTRSKESGGLRITDECLEFLETKADIKTYKITIPKEVPLTAQILVWLDQYIDSPWHIDKRHLKVISERTAFELYMFSGDIKKLGLAKTMSKRLSQESHPQ